jgi:hypothetical protein
MQGTATTVAYLNDESNDNNADESEELSEIVENVSEGDYITVVYETPSNGGSWHRAGGHIKNVRTLHGAFDDLHFEIEDSDREKSGDVGYLHIHESSGGYYFSDNSDTESDWGIKKIAWTPEN